MKKKELPNFQDLVFPTKMKFNLTWILMVMVMVNLLKHLNRKLKGKK